ncbi:ankyrin repeat-containing domain, PGG domain protein, partial [Tanacetum coccineum]
TELTQREAEPVIEVISKEEKAERERRKILLYDSIIKGNTRVVINNLKEASLNPWDKLTNNGNTVLHVAVGSSMKNHELLYKLLQMTPEENTLLDLINSNGSTLLHVAAIGGNTEAVNMLVERNPELLLATDKEGHTPLALSISNMHIKTSMCLFKHMKGDRYAAVFSSQSGEELVVLAISCQDFRLAEMIIFEYPDAILSDSDAVLTTLAQNFPRELNYWERRGDFMEEVGDRLEPYTQRLERFREYFNRTLLSLVLATLLHYFIYGRS